jgi:glycosyltransferase involved in cell wall biosynthesis
MTARVPAPLILHTEAATGLGGQELRIVTEARWLLDHGWDALIACQPHAPLGREAAAAGVPVVAVRMRGAADLTAFAALRRLMRTRRVALVHTHSSVDSWLATLAARSLRLPVVRSRHVTIPIKRRRALVYRLAHRIIASGEAARARVLAVGVPPHRVVAIPAGVDPSRFHPGVSGAGVRRELGLRGPAVGLVANLRRSKGVRDFLAAAAHVATARPDVTFLVVGDGVALGDAQREAARLGLEDRVIFTGFRRDVPAVLAALDVLVLSSVHEAVSQVLLQALAVGTPVVTTAVGGTPEVIRDGETGRLVPPADPQALARAVLDSLADPVRARALARAGQALIQAHYTLDTTMARTTALYRELLAPGTSARDRVCREARSGS